MRHLYLMCGLPFSGKSTLARAIAARVEGDVVSLDELNAERGIARSFDMPVTEWAETHELALQRCRTLMAAGQAVVVDDTNCYRWLREDHRRDAKAAGYETIVVLLDVPLETCLERARLGEPEIPSAVEAMVRMAQEFEAPTLDERPLIFDGESEMGAWLEGVVPVEG
jgi:predicted kinase